MSVKERGFASMDPTKQKSISSMGGKRAHELGVAHQWTTETARVAGRKGGLAARRTRAKKAEAEA